MNAQPSPASASEPSAMRRPIIVFDVNGGTFDTPDAKRRQLGRVLSLPPGVELNKASFACGAHHKERTPCYDNTGRAHRITERQYKAAMEKITHRFDELVRPRRGMPELTHELHDLGWEIHFVTRMYGLTDCMLEKACAKHGFAYDKLIATYGGPKLDHHFGATLIVDNEFDQIQPALEFGIRGVLILPGVEDTSYGVVNVPEHLPDEVSVVRGARELRAVIIAAETNHAAAA